MFVASAVQLAQTKRVEPLVPVRRHRSHTSIPIPAEVDLEPAGPSYPDPRSALPRHTSLAAIGVSGRRTR